MRASSVTALSLETGVTRAQRHSKYNMDAYIVWLLRFQLCMYQTWVKASVKEECGCGSPTTYTSVL